MAAGCHVYRRNKNKSVDRPPFEQGLIESHVEQVRGGD
jgi:hypothetical protein